MSQPKISRRTLAKGAAWATPVVAASVTIPAYAASTDETCVSSAKLNANTYFYYGSAFEDAAGNYYSTETSAYWQINSGNIEITDLESDETITSVTFTVYVEDRAYDADPNTLPAGYYDPNILGSEEQYNVYGDGWDRTNINNVASHTMTVNGVSHTADMWSVTFTSNGEGTYYDGTSSSCRSYVSSDVVSSTEGGYRYIYQQVMSLAMGDGNYVPNQHFQIIAMTSKGRSIAVNGFILNQSSVVDTETVVS